MSALWRGLFENSRCVVFHRWESRIPVAERSHLPFKSSSIYEALLFHIFTLLPIASRFVFFPVSLIPVIVKLKKWKTLFLITVVADIVAGETSETKEDVVASHRRE